MTVRFFASIKEAVGLERAEHNLREGSTVEDLLKAVKESHPQFRDNRKLLVAVNAVQSGLDRRLREGDIVALLPPVSGG